MNTARFAALACALLQLTAANGATGPVQAPPRSNADLAAQFARLLAVWPGVYDNNEQIVRQNGGGLSPTTSEPYFRLRSSVTRVARPDIGEHVLEVREYRDNDPGHLVRHQLYAPGIDSTAGGIRVRRLAAGIPPQSANSTATLPGSGVNASTCDLLLRWEGANFRGGTDPASCRNPRGERQDEQVLVGDRLYWQRARQLEARSDRTLGELTPGSSFGWSELTRARDFRCTVNHDATGDMTRTARLTTIDLDDQGGEADIAWPDGRTLTFVIHRRAFASPPDREFVLFRIHEKGNHVPIAYAYAGDAADRFGLNLGWFYILCAPRGNAP